MADEIISKLGFDVENALSALKKLDSQLTTSGNIFDAYTGKLNTWNTQAKAALATMREMAMTAKGIKSPSIAATAATDLLPNAAVKTDQVTQRMAQLASASSNAGQQMQRAGQRGAQSLNTAHGASKRLFVSFQMMSRIVFTQAIVRGLSQIRNLLRDSVGESIKFQRAISEVLLITMAPLEGSMRETTSTFQSLTAEAADMARRFNVDLGQATEGIYQTISNQFTEVSERTRIMEASMKLAKIGVIDLKDSVLLMTGALNAYGMSAQNADRVASIFFRTIQLGRVRGKELADTLGTVIPIASQLGVSIEEVTAAYVSMTIGGLEAHKASTGLRQAMLAFIKPSEDMKKILRELGYANAEQIIQAKGFVGALKTINDASKNMASEYGKSIRRVRALTASLSLTRNDAKAYEDALAAMSKTSAEHLDELWEKFKEMPAEALTSEINKLKVTLTQELGASFVDVLGSILKVVGGANQLVAVLQALASVAAILGGALLILAAKALIAHAALGPLGIALLGISAVVATMVYQSSAEIAAIRDTAVARRQAAEEEIRSLEEVQQKRIQANIATRREEDRIWEEGMAFIRRSYFKAIDDLKVKNTELVRDTAETMSSMVKSQERVVAAYRSAAKAAADAVQASRERQADSEAKYSDTVFKYANKNEQAYRKAENYMRRAAFLARDAEAAMRKAKTPEDIASALVAWQRADAASQEAENIASGTQSMRLQGDAQRMILFIMQQKVEAEKALQEVQAKEASRLAAAAANEQKRLNKMKVLMKGILADLQAFDKTGAKEPKALAEQQARLKANVAAFQRLWLGGAKIDVADMLAFDKLQQRVQTALEGGITRAQVNKLTALPGTFADFRSQIEKGVGTVRVMLEAVLPKLPVRIQEMLQGATAEETMSVLSSELGKTNDVLRQYEEMTAAVTTANTQIQNYQKLARASLDDWVKEGLRPENFKFEGATAFKTVGLKAVAEQFIKASDKFLAIPTAALKESDFAEVKKAYDKYIENIKPPAAVQSMLENFIKDAAAAASQANAKAKILRGLQGEGGRGGLAEQARDAQQLRPILQNALQQAVEAQRALNEAERAAKRVKAQAGGARTEAAAVSQIDMTGFTTQTKAAANAMWDLAYASASVQTPTAPETETEIAARGGRAGRYLAAGGPVGTDVIPAWLSRKEMVMNERAASTFASQLVAMNAGIQPTFRSEGGSVTNIGDINVTVSGGATGRQTARSIAAELRRELRRGTSIL